MIQKTMMEKLNPTLYKKNTINKQLAQDTWLAIKLWQLDNNIVEKLRRLYHAFEAESCFDQ